jgi:hypothetical protein
MAHARYGEHGQPILNPYMKVVHMCKHVMLPVDPLLQFSSPSIAKIWNKVRQFRHFVVMLGLKLCLHSAQIGETQESLLQPGNSQVEVTGKRLNPNLVMQAQTYFLLVLWAHNLPRLKTLFGKKRRFYVTVTDGMITKKTTTVRSVEQAVEWDEKLNTL